MSVVATGEASTGRRDRLRIAGLDLGTNTCLCLIADVEVTRNASKTTRGAGGDLVTRGAAGEGPAGESPSSSVSHVSILKVIRDEVRVVRLGQGVNATRELHPEALARAEETFQEFSAYIKEAKCDKVLAVATSAARDVKNGHLLVELGRKYGIPIEIISGEKEAELTFAGAIEPSWSGLTAVIDVGGGSTELIIGDKDGIRARVSADVGSVRLTEACVTSHPISKSELDQIKARVRSALAEAKKKLVTSLPALQEMIGVGQVTEVGRAIGQVVGVAGTPTTLAAVDRGHAFETDKVHGHVFSRAKLEEWTSKLAAMTVEQRQKLAGMEPKRADVIVAGAVCVTEAMRTLERESLKVSVRGLRYGVVQWSATRDEQ